MTKDERNFSLFWNNDLERHHKVHPFNEYIRVEGLPNRLIQVVLGKVEKRDLGFMVNLWWAAKQLVGLDTSFNIRQIGDAIWCSGGELEQMQHLIECIRTDMCHFATGCKRQKLELSRILPGRGTVCQRAVEQANPTMLERSRWILFLNDNYRGGKLYFPTRRVVVTPKAGVIVRWPTSFPHGIQGVSGDDPAFYLSGESVAKEFEVDESWPQAEEPSVQ